MNIEHEFHEHLSQFRYYDLNFILSYDVILLTKRTIIVTDLILW